MTRPLHSHGETTASRTDLFAYVIRPNGTRYDSKAGERKRWEVFMGPMSLEAAVIEAMDRDTNSHRAWTHRDYVAFRSRCLMRPGDMVSPWVEGLTGTRRKGTGGHGGARNIKKNHPWKK